MAGSDTTIKISKLLRDEMAEIKSYLHVATKIKLTDNKFYSYLKDYAFATNDDIDEFAEFMQKHKLE